MRIEECGIFVDSVIMFLFVENNNDHVLVTVGTKKYGREALAVINPWG